MSTANYTGKEAAYIKSELLRAYLEPLFMIIGQRELRIGYIDCSSGPWQKGGQDPGDTSIAVSLGIMAKCHNDLSGKFRRNVHFRGLFIEKDKESFGRLESFLKSESWDGVDAQCLKGDFCDLQNEILSWCGNRDFCFFFIDATEWRHIAIPTLEPLLRRPSSEFLISFMFDSIVRARSQMSSEEHMKAILGLGARYFKYRSGRKRKISVRPVLPATEGFRAGNRRRNSSLCAYEGRASHKRSHSLRPCLSDMGSAGFGDFYGDLRTTGIGTKEGEGPCQAIEKGQAQPSARDFFG